MPDANLSSPNRDKRRQPPSSASKVSTTLKTSQSLTAGYSLPAARALTKS
jgi:hypothetical protein